MIALSIFKSCTISDFEPTESVPIILETRWFVLESGGKEAILLHIFTKVTFSRVPVEKRKC